MGSMFFYAVAVVLSVSVPEALHTKWKESDVSISPSALFQTALETELDKTNRHLVYWSTRALNAEKKLKMIGSDLALLEKRKAEAIQNEDFEAAKALKAQTDKLKSLVRNLDPHDPFKQVTERQPQGLVNHERDDHNRYQGKYLEH